MYFQSFPEPEKHLDLPRVSNRAKVRYRLLPPEFVRANGTGICDDSDPYIKAWSGIAAIPFAQKPVPFTSSTSVAFYNAGTSA